MKKEKVGKGKIEKKQYGKEDIGGTKDEEEGNVG